MPRIPAFSLLALAVPAALLGACSGGGSSDAAESAEASPAVAEGAAAPAEGAEAIIKERQENFKGIADSFKAVRGELDKGTPDFALIAARANDINARAGRLGGYFPAGTSNADGFKTEALPAIWEKPEAVGAAVKKLVDESAKLASLAAGGDKAAVTAQVMALGGACKGCHEQFRAEEKK